MLSQVSWSLFAILLLNPLHHLLCLQLSFELCLIQIVPYKSLCHLKRLFDFLLRLFVDLLFDFELLIAWLQIIDSCHFACAVDRPISWPPHEIFTVRSAAAAQLRGHSCGLSLAKGRLGADIKSSDRVVISHLSAFLCRRSMLSEVAIRCRGHCSVGECGRLARRCFLVALSRRAITPHILIYSVKVIDLRPLESCWINSLVKDRLVTGLHGFIVSKVVIDLSSFYLSVSSSDDERGVARLRVVCWAIVSQHRMRLLHNLRIVVHVERGTSHWINICSRVLSCDSWYTDWASLTLFLAGVLLV